MVITLGIGIKTIPSKGITIPFEDTHNPFGLFLIIAFLLAWSYFVSSRHIHVYIYMYGLKFLDVFCPFLLFSPLVTFAAAPSESELE